MNTDSNVPSSNDKRVASPLIRGKPASACLRIAIRSCPIESRARRASSHETAPPLEWDHVAAHVEIVDPRENPIIESPVPGAGLHEVKVARPQGISFLATFATSHSSDSGAPFPESPDNEVRYEKMNCCGFE